MRDSYNGDTDAHEWESDLTEVVIGAAFGVANVIGAGFVEKVYERALIPELALWGVSAKAQVSFPISYKGKYLGEYAADLVVGEKVIVELKCMDRFANEHLAQCINYLFKGITSERGAAHQLPEAQGGMETSPPGSLIS